ncbi:DUF2065 domain-containing protein [Telmatospirillum sp. J64-1]|uniref:DUF2065 domain-containing protein n=1 Tax=Telmatospirillum sp. J64-1 TaxID=2502183 RepID=UPI00115E973D|nr:DUF2065 domain-containing protein [Telmatospirillum sp. J64-1]
MTLFLTALFLAITLEGLLYALFPGGMKRLLVQIMAAPPQTLRWGGVCMAMLGVAMLWLLRGGAP